MFILLSFLSVSDSKSHHQDPCQQVYNLCFLLGVLQFQVLCLVFNPFWFNVHMWCNIVVQFHSSACSNPISQHCFSQFSHSVMSDTLRPQELQYTRLPCPSPTPRACSNSCPLSQWCLRKIPLIEVSVEFQEGKLNRHT